MPTFDVTIGNKTYHVEIPDPGAVPLAVIVDGQRFEVNIAGTEANSVAAPPVEPPQPAPAPVPAPLPLPPRVAVARPAIPTQAAALSETKEGAHGEVVAPMPGTILSVEVEAGQQIKAGQVLVTLEAMKMKNPIRAAQAGTVSEIMVRPGDTVAYGDPLIRFA